MPPIPEAFGGFVGQEWVPLESDLLPLCRVIYISLGTCGFIHWRSGFQVLPCFIDDAICVCFLSFYGF